MIKTVEIDLTKLSRIMVKAMIDVEFLKPGLTPDDVTEIEGQILDSLILEGVEDRFTNMLAKDLTCELVAGLLDKGRG